MTTQNGHQHISAFEGREIPPEAVSQALLDLMMLCDDIESRRLTTEGHQRDQEALKTLRLEIEK